MFVSLIGPASHKKRESGVQPYFPRFPCFPRLEFPVQVRLHDRVLAPGSETVFEAVGSSGFV